MEAEPKVIGATERALQKSLMVHQRSAFMLPNYTPNGWFECDIFEVTKAGYFVEYEIKCSRSDFNADALKGRYIYPHGQFGYDAPSIYEKKYECIGRACGPSRFYYVTPTDLITPEEVPLWAGLIWARQSEEHPNHWWLKTVKRSRKIHSVLASPDVVKHATGICYWRFRRLFLA